jgi:hypothetical protein
MISSVHIPIYCESEQAKAGSLLTLKTVRLGFPTVPITAHWMADGENFIHCMPELTSLCNQFNIELLQGYGQRNYGLIKNLCEMEETGFAVIDSDVVFFDDCEGFDSASRIAGEFIPSFDCPIAKARTACRLHPAFFVVPDPPRLRASLAELYQPAFPEFCPFDPFAPVTVFNHRKPLFYDVCSILYQAIGGESFDDAMLDKFEHCYSGSYAHRLPFPHAKFLSECYENPAKAKGFRAVMRKFYEERKPA